jgi:hypothetical protein
MDIKMTEGLTTASIVSLMPLMISSFNDRSLSSSKILTQLMVVSFAMPKSLPPTMEARWVPSGREKCVSCLCAPASGAERLQNAASPSQHITGSYDPGPRYSRPSSSSQESPEIGMHFARCG